MLVLSYFSCLIIVLPISSASVIASDIKAKILSTELATSNPLLLISNNAVRSKINEHERLRLKEETYHVNGENRPNCLCLNKRLCCCCTEYSRNTGRRACICISLTLLTNVLAESIIVNRVKMVERKYSLNDLVLKAPSARLCSSYGDGQHSTSVCSVMNSHAVWQNTLHVCIDMDIYATGYATKIIQFNCISFETEGR